MSKNTRGETKEEAFKRASHWNDEMIELETRDNLTGCQSVDARQSSVAREAWDLRWEIERLEKLVAKRDAEITTLRFDVAMLKAELNSVRGKKHEDL